MRARSFVRAGVSPEATAASAPPILFDIDWPHLANLITRATAGTAHVLECDRLTTAFGPDVRSTLLVPRAVLEGLTMLGLELNIGTLMESGATALSIRDCEIKGHVDPLVADLGRALEIHGRSIASTIAGMSRCDIIVLGGEAVDTGFLRSAMDAIVQARPIIVLRSPPPEYQATAFQQLVTKLKDYRWLSDTDFTDTAVVSPNHRESVAVAWPTERALPSGESTANTAQQDLVVRPHTPRPRFHTGDRSSARPLQLDMPIRSVAATRGLWGLEQDGTDSQFRWGGHREKSSLYFEVPWPGKFSISIRLHPSIPSMQRPQLTCIINGIAVAPTFADGNITVIANLFRHALFEIIAPPIQPAPGDPRRLTCCIREIGIEEVFS